MSLYRVPERGTVALGALYLIDETFDSAYQLWIADDWILSANFEEGDLFEWSISVP